MSLSVTGLTPLNVWWLARAAESLMVPRDPVNADGARALFGLLLIHFVQGASRRQRCPIVCLLQL